MTALRGCFSDPVAVSTPTRLLPASQNKLGNEERFRAGSRDSEQLWQINCKTREHRIQSRPDNPAVKAAFLRRFTAEAFGMRRPRAFLPVNLPAQSIVIIVASAILKGLSERGVKTQRDKQFGHQTI